MIEKVKQVDELESRISELEQNQLDRNIEVCGLSYESESQVKHMVISLVSKVSENEVQKEDIDLYILKKAAKPKIIVKLCSQKERDRIIENRKKRISEGDIPFKL